jgi:hypothetical protein
VLNSAFQPEEPLAQAVTVAYEPLDLTVMIWVASPTSTGTGKLGVLPPAELCSPVLPDPAPEAVPLPLPAFTEASAPDALGLGDALWRALADFEGEAEALMDSLGEADDEADAEAEASPRSTVICSDPDAPPWPASSSC